MSLAQRWVGDWPGRPEVGRRLLELWERPWRCYHGPQHLAEALAAGDLLGCTRVERLALWFHDAVHRNRPGEDERASARLATSWLPPSGWSRAEAAEVARLVALTEHHRPAPDDAPGARVCDADLAILGAPSPRYRESVAQLRAEQPGVDDARWRRMRLATVEHLLDTHRYATGAGQNLWGEQARINLCDELSALR